MKGKGVSELLAALAAIKKASKGLQNDADSFDPEGEVFPLNEAAQAEQKRHSAAVTDIMARLAAKKEEHERVNEEGRALVNELEAEQDRWGEAIRELQPDLKQYPTIWIDPEGKGYRLPKKNTQPDVKPQQPEWAKEMITSWNKEADEENKRTVH